MDDLKRHPPCAGMLPVTVGTTTLSEVDLGPLTAILPFKGQTKAVSSALRAAAGIGFPRPGQMQRSDGVTILWFGRDTGLLAYMPCPALDGLAACSDQTDGWAAVTLQGLGAVDVLARLVPVDLRPSVFGKGATARTLVGHMQASVTRMDEDTLLILVFRSMAATLVTELKEAMEAFAARG